MKQLTEAQITLQIRTTNRKFRRAPKWKKRVMIAQDAIDQVINRKYVPATGHFMISGELMDADDTKDVQRMMVGGEVKCTVCAWGGLMASCIRINDNVKACDLQAGGIHDAQGTIPNKTGIFKFFTESQMRLIEIAFENGYGYFSPWTTKEGKATEYVKGSNRSRFMVIMQNIVDNKGTFKP